MAATLAEQLTLQFYEWERSGRGWEVFDTPVHLEPTLQPFHRFLPSSTHFEDDSKTPALFATPFVALAKFLFPPTKFTPAPSYETKARTLRVYAQELRYVKVSFPKAAVIDRDASEQQLTVLATCVFPISFEIIASSTAISIQIVSRSEDIGYLKSQIKAYFPESILQEEADALAHGFSAADYIATVDYGLQEEFMRPIAQCDHLKLDPLTGLFGLLEHIQGSDMMAVQILFQGTNHPWTQSIMASVIGSDGKSFFADSPDMLPLAKDKVSQPLYAATIRTASFSDNKGRCEAMAQETARMLISVSESGANGLLPLASYSSETMQEDILHRRSHRLGMILNCSELLTFVHFPASSIVSAKLNRDTKKTKAAPLIALSNPLKLGINTHQGKQTLVTISNEQRLKHTHLIGATGTGKSTLLLNLAVQDMNLGNGVAVLDPHGDLIDSIIPHIPESRINDVILLDPADSEFPIGFNALSAHTEIEKDVLASDLVATFRRFSTSWGDQMNSVFANAILAFLESPKGGTLMDLRRFLVEKSFRDDYIKTVTDPHIAYYWQREFPFLKSTSIGPILTRLDTFLRPKPIRYMTAQKRGLDFGNILDTQKIFLVKLSHGLIGEENSYILGTTFVSKLYQAALARQAMAKTERKDFFIYIDEFQNFTTPSMAAILSGARKYHLGLVLAHQDMQQLAKTDAELANSVTSNAGTRICFRLGDADAKRFENGFASFNEHDLQNLGVGEAIVRIERPDNDFNLHITPLKIEGNAEIKDAVVTFSRSRYATPRSEVELTLNDLRQNENAITETQTSEKAQTVEPVVPPISKKQPIQKSEQPIIEVIDAKETIEHLVKQKEISQHRYLQNHIKRMAESRGYKAIIEFPIADGRVDVSLERNGKRIACEIGVTTTKDWEVHNVKKCLIEGYDMVVAISKERKALELMQRKVDESIDPTMRSKVFVLNPEDFFLMLDTALAKEATKETRIKGYRVKVEYEALPENEVRRKQEAVSKIIMDSTVPKDTRNKG